MQGVLGTLLIRMNTEIAIHRRQSIIGDWPILEVVSASAITAALSYLVSGDDLWLCCCLLISSPHQVVFGRCETL